MTTLSNRQQVVSTPVLGILRLGRTEGMQYFLPTGQLDRKLYVEVNEVLERIGGKWNKKAKAHVFEIDPKQLLELVFSTGEMPPKNPTAHFPTPDPVIQSLLNILTRPSCTRILEPSAGKGNIAEHLRQTFPDALLECCEIVPKFQEILRQKGFSLVASDFLSYQPGAIYDLIVMNPPFAIEGDSLAYVTHIHHAYSLLRPGGNLGSVVPSGFSFRNDSKIVKLRDQVEQCGSWEELEAKSFTESGTDVNTVILSMQKV
jgi:hypothetical protein